MKYHVYGIGNALVDMEIEVNSKFLEKVGVEKGVMTLIDKSRQSDLLNHLEGIQHRRSSGGSAANTIIAVSQLGGNAFYSCKVSDDDSGEFYYQDLINNGVDTNVNSHRDAGITGSCMVFITPDADRTMNTYLGITEKFSENEIDWETLKQSEYLYIEGYLVTSETGRAAAIKAREFAQKNGVKVAMTFSDPNIVEHFKDGLNQIKGNEKLDVLFCNEEEAFRYTNTRDIDEAISKLKDLAKIFAITQGAKGALVYYDGHEIDIVAPDVEAVDTNGAGDLFAGSFLWGLTHSLKVRDAAKLACLASAKLVTQFGARLQKDQILIIKDQIFS